MIEQRTLDLIHAELDGELHVGDLGGRDRIGGCDINGANDAANGDDLLFGVDLDALVAFNEEEAAWEDTNNPGRQRCIESGIARSRTLAIQLLVAGEAREVGESTGHRCLAGQGTD